MKIKRRFFSLLCGLVSMLAFTVTPAQNLTGAGSTFIYPVFSVWTADYAKLTNIQINYQPIGSGGGIRQLSNRTVDFAASDMPLNKNKLRAENWQQIPMIIGGIVPTINLSGISANQMTLSGPILADIYLGQIRYWDNPEIKKLNPKLALPHQMIITVHRADGSGTTFNFTHYLAQISSIWKEQVGSNTVVDWPAFGLGAKGNAGVANQILNTPGSIGYVEYAYAKENHMVTIKLINAAGKTVVPNAKSFQAAAEKAKWNANNDYDLILTNASGPQSWPIDAVTFLLIPKQIAPEKLNILAGFIKWAYTEGASYAKKLDYVPVPKNVYQPVLKSLKG